MTLTPTTFKLDIQRGIAEITLSRPQRLNALTFEIYRELADTFVSLEVAEVRAVVITGEGRGFCSGGDVEGIIKELFARDTGGLLDFTRATGRLIQNICQLKRPVIAAVNGVAVGAGAVIAAACDMRVVSQRARFGYIFPQVGLCGADMGAAYLLPRIVGRGHAAELLFLGEVISASRAAEIGLANRVVAPEQVLPIARQWAEKLAQGPAFAHAMTKQMLIDEQEMSLAQAIEAEAQAQAICMAHPDFRTAYEAIASRRRPRVKGAPGPLSDGDVAS